MKYARSGRHTFTLKLLWAAFLGGLFVAWSLKALSPLARVWDLDQTTQPGQLTVYNTSLKGGYYGMPVEMADLNGDGFMDLVLAPMAANGGNGSRPESGEVYVYPGAGHAFMNETKPSYHPDAARQAWSRTLAFLQHNLKS